LTDNGVLLTRSIIEPIERGPALPVMRGGRE
jgi:hypothetical protein